nr:hypothetical protein [Microbacterium barkeri]
MNDILTVIMYLIGVPNAVFVAIGTVAAHHWYADRHTRRRDTIEQLAFAIDAKYLQELAPGAETGECTVRQVKRAMRAEHRDIRLENAVEEVRRKTNETMLDRYAPGWRTGACTVRQVRRAERMQQREDRQRTWMLEVAT